MPTPVIPVLMGEVKVLKKPVDIIKYVLRSYLSYPRNINDTFADREISFVYDLAELGHQLEPLRSQCEIRLTGVLRYYFPTASAIEVEVTIVPADEVYYSVQFDTVVTVDGQSYSLLETYKVDAEGKLIFEFEGG